MKSSARITVILSGAKNLFRHQMAEKRPFAMLRVTSQGADNRGQGKGREKRIISMSAMPTDVIRSVEDA